MAKNNHIRKILIILIMLFVMIIPNYIFANESNVKLGDINNDTKIDISDLTLILRHISATKTNKNTQWILSDEKFKAADINNNGSIDTSDMLSLLRYIAANKSEKIAEKHKNWLTLESKEQESEKTVQPEQPAEPVQPTEPEKPEQEQKVEVTSIELNKKTLSINEKLTEQLAVEVKPENATDKTIEWSSSKEEIATVDANGLVTAISKGTARITAKSSNGKTATCIVTVKNINAESIKLNKANSELKIGDIETLTATIEPSNATDKSITWISSNTDVATVDSNGKVTAKAEGKVTITAKTANGRRTSCDITVKKPVIDVTNISISKTSAKIDKGYTLTLTATVVPSNATDKSIKWSTSNSKVATVSSGKITAISKGTATITATSSNGKTAKCTIIVNNEVIKKLDGKNVTLPVGDKVYFLDTQFKSGSTIRGSDCFIIESNGKYGMIDTATDKESSRVINYLKELNIKELEFVLITHCHSDHYGGYEDISKKVNIKNLYIKKINKKNSFYSKFNKVINIAKKQNTKIYYVNSIKDKTIILGNFTFKLFNTADRVKTKTGFNENVNSVVALAIVNGKTIYFSSDVKNSESVNAENESAKEIKSYLKLINKESVDIYKVAHHCGDNNNTAYALEKLNPVYAVVTNRKNREGTIKSTKRINKYVEKNGGKMYHTESGTVVLNISYFGEIAFKQLSNYYK